jgi:peptidoglycan/LPS O-acetylase OafA/YrhL
VEVAPEFPALDTLRALGALAVLTTHVTFQSGDYLQHGVWGFLFSRLDVGVAIFFVLSGFLLSRPHLARAAVGRRRPATGRYYWKRLVRIYPVYVVTAVLALALIADNADDGFVDWLRTLLLADVYTESRLPQGLTQMWSLSVEVAFYVSIPLLMVAAIGREGRSPRPARVWAVLTVLTSLSIWWHLQLGERVSKVSSGLPMSWLPSYLTWFAVGIGLALLHVQDQAGGRPSAGLRLVRTLGAAPGACWAMAGALMLLTATPLAGPALLFVASPSESLFKHLVYAAVAALLVGTGVFAPRGGLFAQVMATPALRHLGHISFATFCIHLPVLNLVMSVTGYEIFEGHGLQIWLATAGISLVASELLYRVVEKPGLRLRNVAPPWRRRSNRPSGSRDAATRS